ncbi:MAG: PP2C family protein-serine/threonine phosphatase [bacterium]|nr:MAG: PP2C family protein-serine/threonine phosphatase [bacterium]
MDQNALEKIRETLLSHHNELNNWLQQKSAKKELHLGGAPVKNVLAVLNELETTLQKLDQGKFGECEVCHEDVNTELLEVDYTASVCIDHLSEKQRRSLERDLELAGKVQRQLLPGYAPSLPDINIATYSKPAQFVGGDYYDFFACPNGSQGIAIADVMGKGLSASMLMSNLQATLRIIGPQFQDPALTAQRLNELFIHNLKLIRFISIFLGIYDPKNFTLQYCNAGHHPPFLWKAEAENIVQLFPTGPAIGLSKNPEFGLDSISLEKGDLLLLYTDGILELRNDRGEEFGEERLKNLMIKFNTLEASHFIEEIKSVLTQFSSRVQDDISLMVFQRRK